MIYKDTKKRHALSFIELYILYLSTQHKCTPTCLPTPTNTCGHCLFILNGFVSVAVSLVDCCFPCHLPYPVTTHGQIKGGPSCVCVPITGEHGFDVKFAHCVLYVRIFKSRGFYFSSFDLCIWGRHSVTNMPLCSK